jgi:SAM-dependent methyltransferase
MKPVDFLDLYADADFYDLEFRSRAHELPFYEAWARRAAGPVLEVACGTGRLTLPLARAGVDVTGLDVAPAMLARARRKAEEEGLRVEWLLQDCRAFTSPRTFALIFLASNALQHLHDRTSLEAFFARARRHLAPGGLLILDVFNPDVRKLSRGPDARYHFKDFPDAHGQPIRVEAASEYDAGAQLLRFRLHYLDAAGGEVRTKQVTMRCFFPEELLALCHHNSFEVLQRYGDYSEQPFTSGAPKQILICRPSPARP